MKKKLLFVAITLWVILFTFLSCDYPKKLNISDKDFFKKIELVREEMINERCKTQNKDTILIGGFVFGMKKDEVVKHAKNNLIAENIQFEERNSSKIILFGKSYNAFIEYGFDTLGSLRSLIVDFPSEYSSELWKKFIDYYGNHYLGTFFDLEIGRPTILWYNYNQEIELINSTTLQIRISDFNYSGCTYHSFSEFLKNQSTDEKFIKIDNIIFPIFKLGMKKSEVDLINKEFEKGGSFFDKEKNMLYNKRFLKINSIDSVVTDRLRFEYNESKLTSISIEMGKTANEVMLLSQKIVNLLISKYGKYSMIVNPYSSLSNEDNVYSWIRGDTKIDFLYNEIRYSRIYSTFVVKDSVNMDSPNSRQSLTYNLSQVHIPSIPTYTYDDYQKSQDDYYKSASREKALKDAGYESAAKREGRDRREKVQKGEYNY